MPVPSGLASQTFHQHCFSLKPRPVRKSNTQNRRKYSYSVEVGMRGCTVIHHSFLALPKGLNLQLLLIYLQ